MPCSFTLEHYREILTAALESGYRFQGFHQPFANTTRTVFLRHDLDICIEEAFEMAALEAELEIKATYFVLVNSPLYNPFAEDSLELLRGLQVKGHWVGLHIDLSSLPVKQPVEIEKRIGEMLNFYQSQISLVPVVSFHRPTSDILDRDFNTFISTYSPRFFSEVKYLSDSRGVWREGCPCQVLKEGRYPILQILVHPIWWTLSESQSLGDRLNSLLDKRKGYIKKYLVTNVGPIGRLLEKGG